MDDTLTTGRTDEAGTGGGAAIESRPGADAPGWIAPVGVADPRSGEVVVAISGGSVIVDCRDEWIVKAHRWYAEKHRNTFYARSRIRERKGSSGKMVYLHRMIFPECRLVDHVNGNGLDCRRCNLRPATVAQNASNSRSWKVGKSGYRGVSVTRHGNFASQATHMGKSIHLGTFTTPIEAAKARDRFVMKVKGEFAVASLPKDFADNDWDGMG